MINKLLNRIRCSISLQTMLIWLAVFILFFIQMLWISVELSLVMSSLMLSSLLIIYYATYLVLVPKLLIKGRKVAYIVLSILMVVSLAYFCCRVEMSTFKHFDIISRKHEFHYIFSVSRFFTLFTLTYAISNIIFFSKRAAQDAKQKEELLSEKQLLEARVLKSQINSHFIFNALNNIYSMTYFKDEYTSGYVLKLAQMMRYVMEDCETELTPLHKDVEYIENFIDFQKLRFENDKDIIFTHNLSNSGNLSVPPMIFQPLVENCFKHTPLDVDQNSFIHISMEVKERTLHFVSENSQPLIKNPSAPKSTGIGIENVKRRLSIYYGNHYTLNISDRANCFKVELFIHLSS